MIDIDVPIEALVRVRELHASVDESAARIASVLGERLRCGRGCHACCVDDLAVSLSEAAAIVEAFPAVLSAPPGRAGACAMLDEDGACRVYTARPYVCRTQGLPLRWFERDGDDVVEHRDICPLNDPPAPSGEAAPLEEMPASACWALGRAETVLAAIDGIAQADLPAKQGGAAVSRAGSEPPRVKLRDLFVDHGTSKPHDFPPKGAIDDKLEKRS